MSFGLPAVPGRGTPAGRRAAIFTGLTARAVYVAATRALCSGLSRPWQVLATVTVGMILIAIPVALATPVGVPVPRRDPLRRAGHADDGRHGRPRPGRLRRLLVFTGLLLVFGAVAILPGQVKPSPRP